jgi:hypothetical protein
LIYYCVHNGDAPTGKKKKKQSYHQKRRTGKKGTVPVLSSSSKSAPKQLFMTLLVMIHFDVSVRCFIGTAIFSLT